jgi:hypothetical protein
VPFNSSGVFTMPAGATSAAPLQVIASATWDSIFTDIQTALTQLGQNQVVQTPTIQGSGSFTVATTDTIVLVTASTSTITLPAASTKTSPVTIVGNAAGIFGTHNATITPNGGDTVNGLSTVVLNIDYQNITLLAVSGGWVTL